MKIKVVGGPNDGEWVEAPANLRIGEIVRIAIAPKFEVIPNFDTKNLSDIYDETMQSMTIKYTYYTIRSLHFSRHDKNNLYYLAPQDWSDYQAMRHQMEK